MAAALFLLGCARRLPGFNRNLNRDLYRAYSTTDPIDPEAEEREHWESFKSRLHESCLKNAESWEHWESFNSWRSEYNKNYRSEYETKFKYELYCESKKEVEMLNNNNKEDTEFKYALNFFADISTTDLPLAYKLGSIRFRMPRSTLF